MVTQNNFVIHATATVLEKFQSIFKSWKYLGSISNVFSFQIRSVLSIVPSKENDGSTYRCTVWNRALGQSRKFEASTDIFVNCEFKDNY